MLLLETPVTDRAPATLPTEGLLNELRRQKVLRAGAQFTVVGYGAMAVGPRHTALVHEPEIALMNEGGRRQRVPRILAQEQAVGDLPEIGVHQRKEPVDGLAATTSEFDAVTLRSGVNVRLQLAGDSDGKIETKSRRSVEGSAGEKTAAAGARR